MTIAVFSWVLFVFVGAGIALILFGLFGFVTDMIYWMRKPKGVLSRARAMAVRAEIARKPGFWMDVEFPWVTAFLITAPLVVMLYFALQGTSFQMYSVIVLLFPVIVRRWILRQKRREAGNEIRQFLVELRLQLSSGGTLRPGGRAVRSAPPWASGAAAAVQPGERRPGPPAYRRGYRKPLDHGYRRTGGGGP
jgi:hypothetical protein